MLQDIIVALVLLINMEELLQVALDLVVVYVLLDMLVMVEEVQPEYVDQERILPQAH